MANRTNSSEYFWSYEYYWDYIDPIPVDGSKLKVNKCKYCRAVGANLDRKNVALLVLLTLFFVFLAIEPMMGYMCLVCVDECLPSKLTVL